MPDERLFTRPFLLCFAANLAQGLAFNLFLHFPGFLSRLGAGEVQIGLIAGMGFAAAILSRPPIGRSMDRRGRRGVILAGSALNVAACALFLSVRSIGPWVYAVRVTHGLAEAMLFTSLFTYAADLVPAARRTQGLAIFGVSGLLPISLGGLLGDWILSRGDYQHLFGAAVLLALLCLLLVLPLPEPRTDRAGEGPPPRGFAASLAQADLLPLWLIVFVFAMALAAFFVFIKVFVEATGIGSVGLFFSTYTAAALVLRIGFGWLPDRVGPKRVLFPALGFLAFGFLLLARAASSGDVAVAGLACGVGHGCTFPILFGIVVSRARDRELGAAMSIFTGLFDAGGLVGGPVFGLLIRAFGFPVMFASAAALVAAGAAAFALWDRDRRPAGMRDRGPVPSAPASGGAER